MLGRACPQYIAQHMPSMSYSMYAFYSLPPVFSFTVDLMTVILAPKQMTGEKIMSLVGRLPSLL